MAKLFVFALVMAIAHMGLAADISAEEQIPNVQAACQKAGFTTEQTNAMVELIESMPKASSETEKQQLVQKYCPIIGNSGVITPLPVHPVVNREYVFTWDQVKYSSTGMKLAYWNDKLAHTSNEQEGATALKNMCVIVYAALQNKPTATLDVMPLINGQSSPMAYASGSYGYPSTVIFYPTYSGAANGFWLNGNPNYFAAVAPAFTGAVNAPYPSGNSFYMPLYAPAFNSAANVPYPSGHPNYTPANNVPYPSGNPNFTPGSAPAFSGAANTAYPTGNPSYMQGSVPAYSGAGNVPLAGGNFNYMPGSVPAFNGVGNVPFSSGNLNYVPGSIPAFSGVNNAHFSNLNNKLAAGQTNDNSNNTPADAPASHST